MEGELAGEIGGLGVSIVEDVGQGVIFRAVADVDEGGVREDRSWAFGQPIWKDTERMV